MPDVAAVLVARPPVSTFDRQPTVPQREAHRAEQRDIVIDLVGQHNPEAVVCVGVPFGHSRPQWILPCGGPITVDRASRKVLADF